MSGQSYPSRDPSYPGPQEPDPYYDETVDPEQPQSSYDFTELSRSLPIYSDPTSSEFTPEPYGGRINSVGSWCSPGTMVTSPMSQGRSRRASVASPPYNANATANFGYRQAHRRDSMSDPIALSQMPSRRDSSGAYNGLGSGFDIPEGGPSQFPNSSYSSYLDFEEQDDGSQGPSSPGLVMSNHHGDSGPSLISNPQNPTLPRRRVSMDDGHKPSHQSHSKRPSGSSTGKKDRSKSGHAHNKKPSSEHHVAHTRHGSIPGNSDGVTVGGQGGTGFSPSPSYNQHYYYGGGSGFPFDDSTSSDYPFGGGPNVFGSGGEPRTPGGRRDLPKEDEDEGNEEYYTYRTGPDVVSKRR